MKVPKLRFPVFKETWEKVELDEILVVNSGRDYKHLKPGDIPVYGTGGYMLSVDKALSEDDAVGIGRKGSIDKPQRLKGPFWTVDTLFYCTTKNDSDLSFLHVLFHRINWKNYDESTGVPSLSKATINKISDYVPCGNEQRKIGELFDLMDKKIEKQLEKVEAWREYKKGMMQKLFSQELRFKDEDGQEFPEWKSLNLGDVIDKLIGGGTPSRKVEEYYNGSIPWVTVKDLKMNKYIFDSEEHITELGLQNSSAKIVEAGDLIIPTRMAVGRILIAKRDVAINQDLKGCKLKPNYDTEFIYYLYSFKSEFIQRLGTGSTVSGITIDELLTIKIKLPTITEQQIISVFLATIDKKINVEINKHDALKNQKKAFMQQMFI